MATKKVVKDKEAVLARMAKAVGKFQENIGLHYEQGLAVHLGDPIVNAKEIAFSGFTLGVDATMRILGYNEEDTTEIFERLNELPCAGPHI